VCTGGHWPSHFKESLSVIIPKPGKPNYSTPKSFRPIVLLNTLGKLLEKLLSRRLQFDGVAHGAFHPMQFGGVAQRSTEDAGVYLTHLVRAGWVEGLQTSIVAFDIAQFFPSINHDVLLRVIDRSGFPPCVGKFFRSYLVGRCTTYKWNAFMSGPYPADVGVGQGSALSPVLSSLCLAPILKLFSASDIGCQVDVMSYVDDGTLIA
jgi:Reverse transcriptase (RNA-dependent DNA polymerase)